MVESGRERFEREAREMHAAIRSLFASPPEEDATLRQRLEGLAQKRYFAEYTWIWGPMLSRRSRVFFRPFTLSNFSSLSLDERGRFFDAWAGDTAIPLGQWLCAVDEADDIELTRRLYGWRLQHTPWREREKIWCEDVIRRFSSASSAAARFAALAKIDVGMALDAKTAVAIYEIDPSAARRFILHHLPWFGWLGRKRPDFSELLGRSRDHDADFHFDLYRRVITPERWREDVLELCRTVKDPAALDSELERRHPRLPLPEAAEAFHDLVRSRKRDVVPYIIRHVASVVPRWGIVRKREAKGLPNLLAVANEEGWLDLWAALLRTGATEELFDSEVKRLVRSSLVPTREVRTRLSLIAGHGAEAHMPGVSLARVHPLEEDTALELYGRFPDLVRGPYRMHVAPGWHNAYHRLLSAAIDRADPELVDFFASRAGLQVVSRGRARGWKEALEILSSYFEGLSEQEFVRRASNALSRMPAFAVWNYDELLRTNQFARLLFERSTTLYLSDAAAIRDLLESPQIHVQSLAFRILGSDDPRAPEAAARSADLLQATLLRPLHRRTRLLAFKALGNAASQDERTAGYLVGRMRDALALPEKRYPTDKLVGLIANVLHRWPSLRSVSERPRVFGEVEGDS